MPYNFVNINGQHKQLNFTNVKVVKNVFFKP
jgi:hypothetical protein